ncbi:MAG: DUF5908 family protein [Methylicorpusculum sp.]|uniref:DUF5908 family protein n=1 Tax=Methylicorpusculum sp. TaxID=2713644 RepID=UPI00272395FE|nr:DUF5908 family protein [Methylicorpusculum sp.]MDO9240738.1 DUF5908 family protein [Methylicorpusculum sp.]MDP2203087.1 DUF5908 family protein [Methylicorpusculum sp.]
MPIEIKELHIKVTVNPPQDVKAQKGRTPVSAGQASNSAIDKEAIIAECVEQVLQILNNKRER